MEESCENDYSCNSECEEISRGGGEEGMSVSENRIETNEYEGSAVGEGNRDSPTSQFGDDLERKSHLTVER